MAWLTEQQLKEIGFKYLGKDVKISDKASIYNPGNISIGDHSRIDDFAILSAGEGGIELGIYVHIACHATLIGKELIFMSDFSGVSGHGAIYSSSDPYDGSALTNPTLPSHLLKTKHAAVVLGRHVVVGAGSIILPGVALGKCSVGAMSLVTKSFNDYFIIAGVPAKPVRPRELTYLELEKKI